MYTHRGKNCIRVQIKNSVLQSEKNEKIAKGIESNFLIPISLLPNRRRPKIFQTLNYVGSNNLSFSLAKIGIRKYWVWGKDSIRGRKRHICVCVCTKRVCVKFTVTKVCTVGIYSTYESRYLYSLGEYICLLLIVYLKISLIYNTCSKLCIYLSPHYKPNCHAKNITWLKFTINIVVIQA